MANRNQSSTALLEKDRRQSNGQAKSSSAKGFSKQPGINGSRPISSLRDQDGTSTQPKTIRNQKLADYIRLADRYARSTNLERDLLNPEPLYGWVATPRALEMIQRIARTAANASAGGAWSITGPYGSGKSTLALTLATLFGKPTPAQQNLMGQLDDADPQLVKLIEDTNHRYQTSKTGFALGMVTAQSEPLTETIARALHAAVLGKWEKLPTARQLPGIKPLRDWQRSTQKGRTRYPISASQLVELSGELAQRTPLLLIIDEFGKNLEISSHEPGSDPYLLQQLAELGQGNGLPLFLLTLQHLSFEDYMVGREAAQRKEWAKVQGRFEDVIYIDSPAQVRTMIRATVDTIAASLQPRITDWADKLAWKMRVLGLSEVSNPADIANWYPLHPLAAIVLPELCQRFGQHERTLFSFLTGHHPAGVREFLAGTELSPGKELPSVGLDRLYDFFANQPTIGQTTTASRWTEIVTRIRDTHGLSPECLALLKSVALLNLVSSGGSLRASPVLLKILDNQPENLAKLEQESLLVYRQFADEYRIWQGSELNLSEIIQTYIDTQSRLSLPEVLQRVDPPSPRVAARHSAEHNLLRVFASHYVSGNQQWTIPDDDSPFSGYLLWVVEDTVSLPSIAPEEENPLPVVAVIPTLIDELDALEREARDLLAVEESMNDEEVDQDWVAKRELVERWAQSRSRFGQAREQALQPDRCRWVMLTHPDLLAIEPGEAGRGTAAISWAADKAYPETPLVANEVLNRAELTSQGSQAQRKLLTAMLESHDLPDLGLEGYGPEVAIYKSVLTEHGFHRQLEGGGPYAFHPPYSESSNQSVWKSLIDWMQSADTTRNNLGELSSRLQQPPFGVKAGVIPLLITVALLLYRDTVALYEHGTFCPRLTSDLLERMVKNPKHFETRYIAEDAVARQRLLKRVTQELGVPAPTEGMRGGMVLVVVKHLIDQIRFIPNYTRRTESLSETSQRVRDALLTAVEPDQLLFTDLPQGMGLRPVPSHTKTYSRASDYANGLKESMKEIVGCFDKLLKDLREEILRESGLADRFFLSEAARNLSEDILHSEVRAFVLALANDTYDRDTDWVKAVATVVARKSPTEWSDEDRSRYSYEMQGLMASFRRQEALNASKPKRSKRSLIQVTFTHSDGREYLGRVETSPMVQAQLELRGEEWWEQLKMELGSEVAVRDHLLSWLGQKVLPAPPIPSPIHPVPEKQFSMNLNSQEELSV